MKSENSENPVVASMLKAIEEGDVFSSTVKVAHHSGMMFTISSRPMTHSELRQMDTRHRN